MSYPLEHDPIFPLKFSKHTSVSPGIAVYDERYIIGLLACMAYVLTSWSSYVYVADTFDAASVYNVSESWIYNMTMIYLFAQSIGTLIEPWLESTMGLRTLFINVHILNLLGVCVSYANTVYLSRSFTLETICFTIIGLSQGLVQCPLTAVAGRWFPAEQRTRAVGLFLSCNNFGIGAAYICPGIVGSLISAKFYIVVFSIVGTVLTMLVFHGAPPLPPSKSAKVTADSTIKNKKDAQDEVRGDIFGFMFNYWSWAYTMVAEVKGYGRLIFMNCMFVATMQIASAFVSDIMLIDYVDQSSTISSWLGTFFWLPNFISSGLVNSIADELKMKMDGLTVFKRLFYQVGFLSFSVSVLLTMSLSDYWHGSLRFKIFFVVLGNSCAPFSNLTTDVATDIATGKLSKLPFPVENMVLATQMFCSSALSAIVVSICTRVKQALNPDYVSVYVVASFLLFVGICPLHGFDGELNRLKLDKIESQEPVQPQNISEQNRQSNERNSLLDTENDDP